VRVCGNTSSKYGLTTIATEGAANAQRNKKVTLASKYIFTIHTSCEMLITFSAYISKVFLLFLLPFSNFTKF
jgi:hypothetical protein